jgi:hypothetical protein
MSKVESAADGPGAGIVIGGAGAAIAAAVFVVLTASTGKTHHLFPLLIRFAPGGLPRLLSDQPLGSRESVIAIVAGALLVVVTRLVLVVLDEMPTAMLVSDQPRGVSGEFVLFGGLGALAGSFWGSRPV